MIIHLLILTVVAHLITFAHSLGENCTDHNKNHGICKKISECDNLNLVYELYKLQRDYPRHRLLEADVKNCNSTNSRNELVVCCMEGEIQSKSINFPVGKACVTPNSATTKYQNQPGVCSHVGYCKSILDEFYEKEKLPEFHAYLNETIHQSQRNCERVDQFICCPQDPQLEQEAIATFRSEAVTAELNPPGCGITPVVNADRILGGEPAPEGAWPWMALYGKGSSSNPRFTCGGSIISKRHVLTAAHCVLDGIQNSFVRLGVYDITKFNPNVVDIRVSNSFSHEDYDDKDKHSDVAILILSEEIVFTPAVAPICLPLEGSLRTEDHLNTSPYIVGWGRTSEEGFSSNVAQQARIPVVPNIQCEAGFKREKVDFVPTARQFDKAVICAGKEGFDSCQGDSGGPLMSQEFLNQKTVYYQIGIVSYGIGCGRKNLPGVYASVQYFADWIKLHVEGKSA